jgi:type IV secretory pathway VirB10-like protein
VPPRPDQALGWRVGLVSVIPVVGALVLSFSALADLARASRIDGWLAYLWPGTLDATGVVASLIWLDNRMPADARRAARRLALAAIVLSIAGNGLQHWLVAGSHQPHVTVQMGVAAVPPAVLFGMLHALHLAGRRQEPAADQPASEMQPAAAQPHPADVTAVAHRADEDAAATSLPATPARPELADQQRLAIPASDGQPASQRPASQPWRAHIQEASQILDNQPDIGRPALAKALGIPTSQARKLIDHLRQPANQGTL